MGPGRKRSRVSPPGSSSTSIFCPWCSERAKGRTAQAESSSSLNEYSCSIFFSVSNAGCIEAGARRKTDGEPGQFEYSPRYRTNSSSLRRAWRTYCERSTMLVLPLRSASSVNNCDSSRVKLRYLQKIQFAPSNVRKKSAVCAGALNLPLLCSSCFSVLRSRVSTENQLGGASRNHVGRRVRPRPGNDPWHHGGVRHA
jgi:hypothetical protein